MESSKSQEKINNVSMPNLANSDDQYLPFSGMFDDGEKGLLDILSNDGQDYSYDPSQSSLFDMLQSQPPASAVLSEVVNTPATPTSFSISSSSTEAPNDDQQSSRRGGDDEAADDKEKTNKV